MGLTSDHVGNLGEELPDELDDPPDESEDDPPDESEDDPPDESEDDPLDEPDKEANNEFRFISSIPWMEFSSSRFSSSSLCNLRVSKYSF
jgi:hypothetical protein